MTHSFLFMPDISGYPRFVQETEAAHSRDVIAELLEVVIAADRLGMTVAEIEGDAVLFVLPDTVPSLAEVVGQAQRTFEAFHTHLKHFERDRVCECGACTGAHELSLKFVAHAGPIETIRVRDFAKPYGPDVILAHRLLKNEVPSDEYLLMTAPWWDGEEAGLPDWVHMTRGHSDYSDLGRVCHAHVPLGALKAGLPRPDPVRPPPRSSRPVRVETLLPLGIDDAFELVSNFDHRLLWNRGVEGLEYEPGRVNRVGMPHRCVIGGRLVAFETTTADFGANRRVYGERLLSPMPVADPVIYYILDAASGGTRVTAEAHFAPRGWFGWITSRLFAVALDKNLRTALHHLREVSPDFAAELRAESAGARGTETAGAGAPALG
jgi:hypothetical protein